MRALYLDLVNLVLDAVCFFRINIVRYPWGQRLIKHVNRLNFEAMQAEMQRTVQILIEMRKAAGKL